MTRPETLLARAEAAFEDGDLETCIEALEAYACWRAEHGSSSQEPGDERFDRLFETLISTAAA